jgi:endogenous inhibitor of DNA gyrase (YacG/DUF329 family)
VSARDCRHWDDLPAGEIGLHIATSEDASRAVLISAVRIGSPEQMELYLPKLRDALVAALADSAPVTCRFCGKPLPERPYSHLHNDGTVSDFCSDGCRDAQLDIWTEGAVSRER